MGRPQMSTTSSDSRRLTVVRQVRRSQTMKALEYQPTMFYTWKVCWFIWTTSKFCDFPGPGNFREKKSRTFQEAWKLRLLLCLVVCDIHLGASYAKQSLLIFTPKGMTIKRQKWQKLVSPVGVGVSWWRGTVVESWSLAGELSLPCTRPASHEWPFIWINRPLQVSQLGQLSLSSFRGSINE